MSLLYRTRIKEKAVECANYLLADWKKRAAQNNVSYEETRENEEGIQITVKLDGNQNDEETVNLEDQIKQKIDRWKKGNYLTKQGIWIKKSKIPYVY